MPNGNKQVLSFAGAVAEAPLQGAWSRGRRRIKVASLPRPRPELLGLLALALLLNLWALSQNGWANDYYSAAVRSMASSWHNFLYDSFDPSGVMTVDKPPLALWVQALSVRAFGFNSLSVLVPQALMGMASASLVYDLVRRRFGRAAGFVGGMALALTPITVAISRHNNPDAMLILCCVAALWFLVRGLEDGRTRWLVLSGVAVGLGFEAKMGVALMVVPGIAAAWLWTARRGTVAALRQLLGFGAAAVAVGGAWPLLMALTPAADRPWISGTSDNSIVSLILNYNGFGRLDGQAGGPQSFGGGGGGGGGGLFGGSSGLLRMLNSSFGGQAGWLLGFALVSGIGIAVAGRLRRRDPRTGWVLAIGGAFLVSAVAFSAAKGITHPYYISFLAPFSAALVGGGFGMLVRRGVTARVFAPLAVAGGVVSELIVLHNNPGQFTWLPPLLVAFGFLAAVALAGVHTVRTRMAILGVALGMLMVAPASWAVQTLGHPTNGTFPAGGPVTASFGGGPGGPGGGPGGPGGRAGAGFGGGPGGLPGGPPTPGSGTGAGAPPGPGLGGFGGPPGGAGRGFGGGGRFGGGGPLGGSNAALTEVASYVKQHGGGAIGVSSQTGASSAIIKSGLKVAGIGGFSGRESEVSVKWLADAVQSGRIRWVLVDSTSGIGGVGGPGSGGRVGASKVMAAVAQTCTKVKTVSGGVLYDCSGHAAALRAAG
jgi:4-amino-4-deoxy-L-arabinose transferase-like glycosyltransferase